MLVPAPFSHLLRLSGVRDEVVGAAGTVVDKKELGERERDAQYWAPGCWAQRPGRVRGGEREASRPRAAGLRERWGAGREDIAFCRGPWVWHVPFRAEDASPP